MIGGKGPAALSIVGGDFNLSDATITGTDGDGIEISHAGGRLTGLTVNGAASNGSNPPTVRSCCAISRKWARLRLLHSSASRKLWFGSGGGELGKLSRRFCRTGS